MVYVTVRRYEGVTDTSEVARQVNEGFLPIVSEIPGFVDYYLVDAGEGVMFSTGVFEHKSGAEESSWRAGEYIGEHGLASVFPNPPQITEGEVVAHRAK
jgi:hypothetical protein